MVEHINVNGPIEIKDSSRERVAYDLALRIANAEAGPAQTQNQDVRSAQKNRKYWLSLYSESLNAVNGRYEDSED